MCENRLWLDVHGLVLRFKKTTVLERHFAHSFTSLNFIIKRFFRVEESLKPLGT